MFVADAPTTTTQRLKAMATGGLPSFFDVSNSFSAGELTDDNLVDQLAAGGRRPVCVGVLMKEEVNTGCLLPCMRICLPCG